MNDINAISNIESWLNNFLDFEKLPKKNIFWLDTMEFLCKRFHYPQDNYHSIHIAGSKGKGSVSTMIASILNEANLSCGLYTSPHILSFAERITQCGKFFSNEIYEIAGKELMNSINALIPEQLPGNRQITWFELVTLYAFLVFKYAKINWAVFETGLGGKLDATNVLSPDVCVLTPIELEHTQFLGDTLEKISTEKAGIIKYKTPVFSANQDPIVSEIFNKTAKHKQTNVIFLDDILKKSTLKYNTQGMEIELDFYSFFSRPIKTTLKLYGKFQVENAALAALVIKNIFPHICESTIEKGLQNAFLPARFEIIEKNEKNNLPKMILDGAHTVNSINFTLETIHEMNIKNIDLLFACAADKNVSKIASLFFNDKVEFSNFTFTNPGYVRPGDFSNLKKYFNKEIDKSKKSFQKFVFEEDCKTAINFATKESLKNNSTLLVIGSFYLISEVKKYFYDI
ncbi:MAG: bifunctional folylpolyglutamate synthase/dihydrofolate synthase [Treponema sp.]|nr:bifunctional folylpolyglutamate synthase/dihydrofolate synthase [Treponema sp.]